MVNTGYFWGFDYLKIAANVGWLKRAPKREKRYPHATMDQPEALRLQRSIRPSRQDHRRERRRHHSQFAILIRCRLPPNDAVSLRPHNNNGLERGLNPQQHFQLPHQHHSDRQPHAGHQL